MNEQAASPVPEATFAPPDLQAQPISVKTYHYLTNYVVVAYDVLTVLHRMPGNTASVPELYEELKRESQCAPGHEMPFSLSALVWLCDLMAAANLVCVERGREVVVCANEPSWPVNGVPGGWVVQYLQDRLSASAIGVAAMHARLDRLSRL